MAARMSIEGRFWSKVEKQFCGCWLWRGTMFSTGYGSFKASGKISGAHRVGYELLKGPIPAGLQLDHLCRVRKCVNPEHLEPVTLAENLRRGVGPNNPNVYTHCKSGHPLSGDNLLKTSGHLRRRCRACANITNAKQRLKRKNGVKSNG